MLERALNTIEAGRVARYHAVPTVQPQTVGLHSWGVAIILLYLTRGAASSALLQAALLHDAAELFTGDMPFTVKRDSPELKEALLKLEDQVHRTLVLDKVPLCARDEALLKLADTLEGLLWCKKTELHGPVQARWTSSLNRAHEKFATILPIEIIDRSKALATNPDYICHS